MPLSSMPHDSSLPTALVIEADAHYLIAITNLLRDLGIRCKRNTTGRDIGAQLATLPGPPAFILLSLDLPAADPLAIARMLRSNPLSAQVPLLGMGARGLLLEYEDEAVALGFAALLPKPLPRERFQRLIEQLSQNFATSASS